jgi:hypothetical protein
MRRRRSFNPKRRLATNPDGTALKDLAKRVRYGGNPEHKRNPGNFGLTPPAAPRPDKTLCDEIGLFGLEEAQDLLRRGIEVGMISEQEWNGYPQNVWAVTASGHAVEAQLENREAGVYHGYPMLSADPLAEEVLERWPLR